MAANPLAARWRKRDQAAEDNVYPDWHESGPVFTRGFHPLYACLRISPRLLTIIPQDRGTFAAHPCAANVPRSSASAMIRLAESDIRAQNTYNTSRRHSPAAWRVRARATGTRGTPGHLAPATRRPPLTPTTNGALQIRHLASRKFSADFHCLARGGPQRIGQQGDQRIELHVGRGPGLLVGPVPRPGGQPRLAVDQLGDPGVDGLRGDDAPRGDRFGLPDAVAAVDGLGLLS